MLKLTNKFFRQLNHHNITLTCNIDDTYQELYDTRLDLTLHTKSLTQIYHSPKPLTLHICSSRIQKTDTKHHYKPLTDHKSSSSRTDNKPLTCEEDGLTQPNSISCYTIYTPKTQKNVIFVVPLLLDIKLCVNVLINTISN